MQQNKYSVEFITLLIFKMLASHITKNQRNFNIGAKYGYKPIKIYKDNVLI